MTGWTYYPELLATPVPRYTSYPTAAEFHKGVGRAEMEQALADVRADQPISLYVHIPYCHEICWYCGCNTGAANRTQRLTSYLETLESEMDLVAARLDGRGRVKRIAFGGGSPNAIPPERFTALLETLRWVFAANDATLSIELDPRSMSDSWYKAIAAAGIERASLGVQTLEPIVQQAIGRVQPLSLIETCVGKLRQCRRAVTQFRPDVRPAAPGRGGVGANLDRSDQASTRTDRAVRICPRPAPHSASAAN